MNLTPEQHAIIEAAAERGARKALASVGLHDDDAIKDVIELRSLLDSWRAVKRGALGTLGKAVAVLVLGAIAYWAGAKDFKL